jgi:beta-glucosidase
VTNGGGRAAVEVVQIYVRQEVGSVTPVVRQLAGFRRVPLGPGEARTVDLVVGPEQLAMYGRDLRSAVEPGMFRVFVGPNSVEGLEARFEVATSPGR